MVSVTKFINTLFYIQLVGTALVVITKADLIPTIRNVEGASRKVRSIITFPKYTHRLPRLAFEVCPEIKGPSAFAWTTTTRASAS
jgi:hypothetical protein